MGTSCSRRRTKRVPLPGNLQRGLEAAFERGAGMGCSNLGIREVGTTLPADFGYWREFAGRYVTLLCTSAQPDAAKSRAVEHHRSPPGPAAASAERRSADAARGNLNGDVLAALWELTDAACAPNAPMQSKRCRVLERAQFQPGTSSAACISIWPRNRSMNKAPFGHCAYTTRLSAQSRCAASALVAEAAAEYPARRTTRVCSRSKRQEGARECAG